MFRDLASFSIRRRVIASSTAPRCALYHCMRAFVRAAPPTDSMSLAVIGCPSRMARGAEDGAGEEVAAGGAWKAAARTSRAAVSKATSDEDADPRPRKSTGYQAFAAEA